MTDAARLFPMQRGQSSIPWSEGEWFYRCYAALYGRSQSLQRLAERYGSTREEVLCVARELVEDAASKRYIRNVQDLPAGTAPAWLDPDLVADVEKVWAKQAGSVVKA